MGILPGVCLLALLSVNLGEATPIAPDHLKHIIDQFHAALPQGEKLNQFAFLVALSNDQCSKKLTDFSPTVPQKTPHINLNYIAFKPGPMPNKKWNCCSETNILFSFVDNVESPAKVFGQIQTEKNIFKDGGCVIFYTTNTPCTRRCFNETDNPAANQAAYDIVGPLTKAPFDEWKKNSKIDLYFVYTNVYLPKKKDFSDEPAYSAFKQFTENGFKRLDEKQFYLITRCDNNGCQRCYSNTNFCLGQWPQWSQLT